MASLVALPKDDEAVAFVQASIRKPHTDSARRFARYKVAHTVHEARELGASKRDLEDDLRRGVLHPAKNLRHWSVLRTIQLFAPSDKAPIAFAPNLKRPNSKAWGRYQQYCKAKTIEEAKRLGIWPGDVANDISQGLLGTQRSRWESMGLKVFTSLTKKKGSKAKSANATTEQIERKLACTQMSSKQIGMTNEKLSVEQKRKVKSKELSSKRNAECRAARTKAREAWAKLGGSSVAQPLAWSRKRGWAEVAAKQ